MIEKQIENKLTILAIRDTGLTNMFDVNTVQRLAYERDFYELVLYLEDHRKESVPKYWQIPQSIWACFPGLVSYRGTAGMAFGGRKTWT